jgi:hypothetical protein
MLRLRATFVLATLLAPLVVKGQGNAPPDPALWRFVAPGSKALIGIDWARIRQSPTGVMIREKWLATGALPAIPGVELLDDIDRLLISSPGKDAASDSGESPILIAIHGHFDAGHVHQLFTRLGSRPQSYNSFQVYRPRAREGSVKDTAWVLFDPTTILYGDAPSVFAALDRNQFPQRQPAAGSLMARGSEMEANYEFWVLMDGSELESNDQVANLFHSDDWASEAQSVEVGVSLRTGLAADITVRFSSEATAKQVTADLTRVMSLVAKDRSSGAPMQDIAKKLKFNLDGSAAKIALRLTPQELAKNIEAFAAGRKAAAQVAANPVPAPNGSPVATATPVPAANLAPPARSVIRIEGLDDGPVEIPYPAQP